ncbi:MAG: class I SAM-dependent methyltransferase [Candidatus Omnitrophota bacterium]|nr:class I SAM-dependent methyltransferase [Candidatus Omnitrophota bacterium]
MRVSPAARRLFEQYRDVHADAYVQWLCTVVGGWLSPTDGNLRAFDYAMRHMPSEGSIVEIGAFLGLSTNLLTYLAVKHHRDNPFFTCDPWTFEGTERPIGNVFDASRPAYRHYAREVFKLNTALFSEPRMPSAIDATSERFFELWRNRATVTDVFGRPATLGGPISFAYLDGAHEAEAARRDFAAVDPHVGPGGLILFDDSADNGTFPEVTRLAAEVARHPAYELVFNTPNYFVRKRGQTAASVSMHQPAGRAP